MSKIVNAYYILDEIEEVELKIYLEISQSKKRILELVIILFLVFDDKKFEVLKYDYSQKEKLHVHKYYLKEPKKEYLDYVVDAELVIRLRKKIEIEYKKYIILFKQKEYI